MIGGATQYREGRVDHGRRIQGASLDRRLNSMDVSIQRTYWLNLFSVETWQEFLDAGADVTGFSESRWTSVMRIREGDILLCYLTGVSRLVAVLEVVDAPYQDTTPIWKKAVYPSRVRVKVVVTLTPETAVPFTDLRDELSIFRDLQNPNAWTGRVRGSPTKWSAPDGKAVLRAIEAAKADPIARPMRGMRRSRPKTVSEQGGEYTVPVDDEKDEAVLLEPARAESAHDEIQWMLLRLGNDMGLHVWVARNDRSREVQGNRFADLPRLRTSLPLQFDTVTNQIIEYIDVLWLNGNAIAAAFEIESTTSIDSGLLRMSDLVAMQPNLNIPLFIVAPDERRDKVIDEINRPTFSRRDPPLYTVCRFIPFSTLRAEVPRLLEIGPYLRPEVLDRLSEDCTRDAV